MLRKFLLTAGIAVGVFGLSIGLGVAVSRLWGTESAVCYYTISVCYYTAFYLSPVAFLVGVIGSIFFAVKLLIGKTKIGHC